MNQVDVDTFADIFYDCCSIPPPLCELEAIASKQF